MNILVLIVLISCLSWLYLFFIHGRINLVKDPFFWSNKFNFDNINVDKSKTNNLRKNIGNLSIIIPARNEEKSIGIVISSVIKQTYKNFNIILINDHSSDGTVEEMKKVTKKYKFNSYEIINSKPLPNGWTGKTWALNQGIITALKNKKNKYLMFLDADIIIKNDVVENLYVQINKENLQMVSIMAKLHCSTFWEKLLIPSFIFFFQKLFPFNKVNNKNSSIAAGAGGCIICKSSVFRENKIMDKIKSYIIDDCNLAKQIKKIGTIWLGISSKVLSVRVYSDLEEIWRMVSRCAFEQLNNSYIYLLVSSLGMLTIYIICPMILICDLLGFKNFEEYLYFFIFIPIFLMTISYYPTIKFYKLNFLYTLTLPISAIFYLLMTISSAYNYAFKDGNNWKNRTYKNFIKDEKKKRTTNK